MADALLERLGGELVARLAETLEIGNETARLVIDASGAALVAALAQQASAPGGSARITRLLEAAEGSPDAVLARLLDSDDAAGTEPRQRCSAPPRHLWPRISQGSMSSRPDKHSELWTCSRGQCSP